ncbi:MAG: glucodextranase DOMON-like domain-containing protein [Elusimicrobiota bacterium]
MFMKNVVFIMLAVFIASTVSLHAVPLKKKMVEEPVKSLTPAELEADAKTSDQPAVTKKAAAPAKRLVPLAGHPIKVDKSISDWIGDLPAQDDSWIVNQGEYIWRDAQGDDNGTGSYTYPTNAAFTNCADIREIRITWDSKNLYFMIKCRRPGDYWAPYRMIGIHKENSSEQFTTLLAQGNPEDMNPEEGCMGNIKAAPELACQYVIGLSSTWKAYIWNAKNRLIAKRVGKEDDTPGFRCDDANWSAVEVSVPLEIIGNPAGQTWKFIIGVGTQESDYLRKVVSEQTEWLGGGGDGDDKVPGACPYLYDLAGAPKNLQEKDLNSYKRGGSNSDSSGFAVIKNSYLTVKFADKPEE